MDLEDLIDLVAEEQGFVRDPDAVVDKKAYTIAYTKLSPASKFFGSIGVHPGGAITRYLRVHAPRSVEMVPTDHYRSVSVDVLYPGSIETIRHFIGTGKIHKDS